MEYCVKVSVLHIGDTKVPFGQFYGGSNGEWLGLRAISKFLTDKSHYIMVPLYAFLIEHPQHGAMLFDTGINWNQAHDHRNYYKGPLLRAAFDEDEYSLDEAQQLLAQLRTRGLDPSDIKTVALTHLHEDQLGGVRDLPGARFLVSAADWTSRNLGIFLFRRTPSLKGVLTDPQRVQFTDGPFHSFESSQDVFGDGSVVLLPTPGHSAGHMAVFIDAGDWQLLCAGDTLYTLRHLATDQLRPIMLGKKAQSQQLESIARIRTLRTEVPGIIIAPGHDHTDYGVKLESAFQGAPTPTHLDELREYADRIIDRDGRLREPSHAVYLNDPAGGTVGTVGFE